MAIENAEDLLKHDLRDMYFAEKHIAHELSSMQKMVVKPELKDALSEHQKQTEEQARRLEQVFQAMGEKPKAEKCDGVLGLSKEHEKLMKEKPSKQVTDILHINAGIKTERYEISAYEGMVKLARQLGLDEAQRLLEQNLQEERETEQKLMQMSESMQMTSGMGMMGGSGGSFS